MIDIARAAAAAAMIVAFSPAFAEAPPPAPKLGTPTQNLALHNWTDQPITQATATLAGSNQTEVFTANGPIAPNGGQHVYVPPGSCIGAVSVRFRNGQQLRVDGLRDCNKPTILVNRNRIDLTTAAAGTLPMHALHSGEVLTR
ncbi:MAG: hypothetical protein JO047_09475 [Alphaproteobacteria bacterium]|nr:hypothetical protein [Alphaproteobacteria bacterium]